MDTLLVAGTSIVGLAVGGMLDPVARRLADRSLAEQASRAAEAEGASGPPGTAGAAVAGPDGPAAPAGLRASATGVPHEVRHGPVEAAANQPDAPFRGQPDGVSAIPPAPVGPSPVRTASAAALTGLLFGGAAAEFGAHVILVPFCVFFAMLVAVSSTDLTHRLVPRRLVYGALALIVPLLVLVSAVDTAFSDLGGAAVAGAVAFGVFFALWWFVPRGMGFGDVRLAGAIGVTVGYLSLLHAYIAFLSGFVIGMIFGLVTMAVSGTGRRTRIPFAPSLAAGAAIGVFWGAPLAHHLFHAG